MPAASHAWRAQERSLLSEEDLRLREAWPYHFDPLFDWISALPICSSAKILLARLHNSNRTLERVKRGEAGPFTFPWELQEIARTFRRVNSAVTKWRAELEASGAASYDSGSWTLPVPEFFRETRFTHFTKVKSDFTLVKCPSLLEEGEEYEEGTNTCLRTCARDNRPLGSKKIPHGRQCVRCLLPIRSH